MTIPRSISMGTPALTSPYPTPFQMYVYLLIAGGSRLPDILGTDQCNSEQHQLPNKPSATCLPPTDDTTTDNPTMEPTAFTGTDYLLHCAVPLGSSVFHITHGPMSTFNEQSSHALTLHIFKQLHCQEHPSGTTICAIFTTMLQYHPTCPIIQQYLQCRPSMTLV